MMSLTPQQQQAFEQLFKAPETLTITHNYGFFSCCSVRLFSIIQHFNRYRTLPKRVDCSKQFQCYKPKTDPVADITSSYFLTNDISIPYTSPVQFHVDDQYKQYKEINYASLQPFMSKYFSLTPEILGLVTRLKTKYEIDYDTTCVLFYRGNDKASEINISKYSDTIDKAKEIQCSNPGIRFLVQSDETEYIQEATSTFTNSFYCKHEIRHMTKRMATVDHVFPNTTYEFSKYFLAITYIMSQCKYVVSGSNGNCSLWIALFRGNANGLYQYPTNAIAYSYTASSPGASDIMSVMAAWRRSSGLP